MAQQNILLLREALKLTRRKGHPFSITFIIKSGEEIHLRHAQKCNLPAQFGKLEKQYLGVEDLDNPRAHPYPVFLWAIKNINGHTIAL